MVTHVTHVITANSPEQHQPKKKPSHIDTSKVLNPQINGCTSVESDSEELLMVPPVGRPVCVCVCQTLSPRVTSYQLYYQEGGWRGHVRLHPTKLLT